MTPSKGSGSPPVCISIFYKNKQSVITLYIRIVTYVITLLIVTTKHFKGNSFCIVDFISFIALYDQQR